MKILGLEITRTKANGGLGGAAPTATPVRSSLWGWIREPFAGAWQRGVQVEPLGAVASFGAVYACVSRIANDIAKLDLELKIEDSNGIYTDAPATSPYWTPLRTPNHFQNHIQFLNYWLTSKLLYGNAYLMKRRDGRGIVNALYPLDPRRVTPMVTPEGDVYYSLSGDDLSRVPSGMVVPASEIIHDRYVTLWHPLVGVSPIYACAASATQGMRIQHNSSVFFENMSRPSGMLTAPGTINDETARRLKEAWEGNYNGMNIGRTAILGDGLKYEPMTVPAHDAQLIEQLGWTIEDVARCFAMPLYKINSGPMPNSNNVEALESQYYTGCLQVLVESIELCLTEGLGVPVGYEVEVDLDGLLRMDSSTQIDMLSKAVGGAIMSPNEARQQRNLPPVAGGDSVYLQQQNFSLEALARRDAMENPFAPSAPAASASSADDSSDDYEDSSEDISADEAADDTPDDVTLSAVADLVKASTEQAVRAAMAEFKPAQPDELELALRAATTYFADLAEAQHAETEQG